MFPPEFESIESTLIAHYHRFLMDDDERVAVPDLLTAEERVVSFVRKLGVGLLQTFVDVRAIQAKKDRLPCACGNPTSVHRTTNWPRKTLLGPIIVRDPYIYCRACHHSARPLHSFLGTGRETWSLAVEEAAVDLAADESCGKAVAKLERHHPGVEMDRGTALRMLHRHGKHVRAFIDSKLDSARRLAEQPSKLGSDGAEELEVEWDAGMIPVANLEPIVLAEGEEPELTPVRGLPKRRKVCRWEEAKVGLAQKPGEVDRLYSVRPTGELEESFDDLLSLALMKGWTEQTQVRGLADGAPHIRSRMEEIFDVGDFRFILDRPHCKEHLTSAGEQLKAEGSLEAGISVQKWADEALAKLEVGNAAEVVDELTGAWVASGRDADSRNDQLRLEAGYFDRNSDAVAYAEYRAQKWSTASSEVESAQGHVVQDRLKISGAWWLPDDVGDILALHMLRANGWWEEYWDSRRAEWRREAKGFAQRHEHAA